MTSNRAVTALLLIAALAVVASPVSAQYMYLDSNGNGVHDSGDRLGFLGVPTTVDVWLDTNHNRDGSIATCDVDATQPLALNDYYINLQAAGGLVSFSGFATHVGNPPIGEFNPHDGIRYGNGLVGIFTTLPPGLHRIATLTITGTSGTPQVQIVDLVSGHPQYTMFGTAGCFGHDFDNVYKLAGPNGGTDWTDVDGLAPAIDESSPVLAAIGNKTVNEGDCLNFTATGFAPDNHPVSFSLSFGQQPPPAGASITTGGQFTWCPTEAQGPGLYPVTVTLVDNVTGRTDSETIQVTVNEVNLAPVLNPIGNKTVPLGAQLTFTATATDADVPANTLTFSLDPGAPTGATIGAATGVFSWTPSSSGTFPATIRVTDNGTPPLSDSETISINICLGCGISAPVLVTIGNKTVNEGSLLSFFATATDPDAPPQTLTFSLGAGAPAGAAITTGGAFTWTPTEAQGPGVYPITVIVTDDGVGHLSDSETIQVTVNEVNQAPVLAAISNKTVMAGNTLAFTATATDGDLPANTLSFSLDPGAPAGASITSGGNFTWTPTSLQAPGNYLITVRVTDNGVPALSDAKSFAVAVPDRETGPPVITNPGNKTMNEGECLNFTVTATSAGGGQLTFTLGAGAPAGASITSGGQFSWCPTEAQGPGVYTITVNCSDGVSVASTNFTVAVLEVNQAPVLAPIGDKTACGPGALVSFTATATDPDLPANTLTFSIDPGAPPGATIGAATGVFSWTPQSGGTFPFTIRVTDNGSPPLSDSETITIIVPLGNQPPVLNQPADMTVTAGLTADQALTATDTCDAASLTFTKVTGPAFVTVTSAGNVHLAPGPTDVGTHVVTVAVSDGGTPSLSDQKSFTVTVLPNDALPVLQPIANMTVDEGGIGTQTIFASEPDNAPLTFVKVSGPFWVLVQTTSPTTGLITATPDFSSGGNTYPVTIRATNGVLYDQRSFTISVNEVCQTPVADAGGPYTGQLSQPVEFDGTGSSDASGILTSFIWDFGDGSTGSGATVSHTYNAIGTYTVVLTVGNGCGVTSSDATTVTVFDCHSTQAFVVGGSKQISLQSGKPTWCVQVEALDYDVTEIDLSSIVLHSTGTGSVEEIHALSDKTSVGGDRNGNGLSEITACFRKEDLRQLFSNVTGTQQLLVTLTGNLSTGGSICAAGLTVTVKGGGGAIAASISPNPLNPSAVLTFTTQARGPVLVQLFDVHGRLVRTLRDESDAAAGYHDVRIDGTDANGAKLSSGVYYVRVRAGVEEERRAITILK
jgi:hypothetical protein